MAKLKKLDYNDKRLQWLEYEATEWSGWLGKANVDRCYYDGAQWTSSDAAELERIGQPVITVNHIWGRVNTLVGMLLQENPTINCFPRGKNDADLASIGTKVVRYIFDIMGFRYVLGETATDMAVDGLGWMDVRITSELTKDPITIEYVPFDEVIYDHKAKQPDFSDARYVMRARYVDFDMFTEFFPAVKGINFSNMDIRVPGLKYEWYDERRKRIFVVEMQYKKYEDREVFWDGFQAVKYVPEIHKRVLDRGIGKLTKARIPIIRKSLLVGDFEVEDVEMPYMHGYFTYVPFVAFRDKDGHPYGIVRQLKDMQDEVNKRRSKVLHYLTAKRVLAESGAIDDPDSFMDEIRNPDAFLEYRRGYEVKIEADLELGQQHFQLMQEAGNEMSVISGIFPDFFGQPTNARNAAAIRQRVLQSRTSVQKFFAGVERGIKRVAEIVLALAQQYYTTERYIQLTDEPEAILINETLQMEDGTIQVRNNLAEIRADITVDVVSGGATKRQEQLTQLVEMIKVLPPEVVMMSLDVLLDAFDLPQKKDLKQRYMAMIQSMMQRGQVGNNPEQSGSGGE